MPRIYVISRPGAATDLTDLLADLLRQRYGANNVTRGSFGRTLVEYTQQAERDILACDVALVVLGPGWLSARDHLGRQALAQADDPVRIALALALGMKKLIAPVLREGATAPNASELPEDVRQLAHYQAFPVRAAPFFAGDLMALVQQINTKLTWKPASASLAVLSGLATLCSGGVSLVSASFLVLGQSRAQVVALSLSGFSALILFPIISAIGGALAYKRKSWRWMWALMVASALTLISIILIAIAARAPDPGGILFVATGAVLLEPIPASLAFLLFALMGPRRETAFA